MIRINLLPVRKARKQQAGQRQLVVMVLLVLAVLGGLFFLYDMQATEVQKQEKVVARLAADIRKLKKDVGDFGRLKQQRQRLMAQQRVINKLHKGRTGPVYLMRELSDILSEGKGPTVDRDSYEKLLRRDPSAGFNPNWNPKRIWLTRIDQRGKGLRIAGAARGHDDVAELWKRLKLSIHFHDVQLQRGDRFYGGRGLQLVRFGMSCRTN